MIEYLRNDGMNRQGYSGRGWYFWDETHVYCYGPYFTKEEANEKLGDYLRLKDMDTTK